MTDRPHRSIGEVLHLLENEFPEVTISKIRFLESQGLLNPERTPSEAARLRRLGPERGGAARHRSTVS